jgi:alpha-methylacyl-CoA racemase
MLDSGAHFYDVYETADGKYISIGSVEPQFYGELLRRLGIEGEDLPQMDPSRWVELKNRFAGVFKTKTRQQWCEVLEGTDVCFAPVLSVAEAPQHAHNQARGAYIEVSGVVQPRPAPRFSRTHADIQRPPARVGEHTEEALRDWGIAPDRIAALKQAKAIV